MFWLRQAKYAKPKCEPTTKPIKPVITYFEATLMFDILLHVPLLSRPSKNTANLATLQVLLQLPY